MRDFSEKKPQNIMGADDLTLSFPSFHRNFKNRDFFSVSPVESETIITVNEIIIPVEQEQTNKK